MMKIELTGKQSLVTGSTAGIGLAIAPVSYTHLTLPTN